MRSSLAAGTAGLAALALLAGCTAASSTGSTAPAAAPVVIATTTQLGSITADIARCAGATSATLMGPGDDPHDFSVASSEVVALTRAKLVVANGLGLEEGLTTTLKGAQSDGARVFDVAPRLDPITYAQFEAEQSAGHAGHSHHSGADADHAGHDHGAEDPHVHMDVGRMAQGARLIGADLTAATGQDAFTSCGTDVEAQLKQTDAEVRRILAEIPQDKRVLITDHEAYNYFAKAYGFEVAGVVIPGGSTDAEPSSADLAALVKVIREDHVSTLISNNAVNPRLVEAVAREAGTQVKVVQLYEGSVGPAGSGADTYAAMMTTNARLLADALK